MSRYESSQRPELQTTTIKVQRHPELLEAAVPYNVGVDADKIARLLLEYGMPEKKLAKLTVRLQRRIPNEPAVLGLASGTVATIACDPLWKIQCGITPSNFLKDRPDGVMQHELKHLIDNTRIRTRLVDRAVQGFILLPGAVAFPIIHLATTVPTSGLIVLSGITEVVGATAMINFVTNDYHRRTPWERRARAFEERLRGDERWNNLITFQAKNS